MTHAIIDIAAGSIPLDDLIWATDWFGALAKTAHEGTSLAPLPLPEERDCGAVLAWIALNLQRIAGVPVTFWFGSPHPNDDGFVVVVQHKHASVGLGAIRLALRWLAHHLAIDKPVFDLVQEFEYVVLLAGANDHEVMGRALAAAAAQRGIPATLIDPRGGMIELGNGCYRKRYYGCLTSSTPNTSTLITRDKYLTTRYLQSAGLPVPANRLTRSLGQALRAAQDIGYPVVIKPVDQGNATGVFVDLRTGDDLRAKFDIVANMSTTHRNTVIVEQFIQGRDYRATIVNDSVIAVSERIYPRIIGDGAHTIRELIDIENTNPRRGTNPSSVYRKIAVDDEVLANLTQLASSLDDIPPPGREIVLKQSGHRRDGALHIDVTGTVHPANAALLRTAAKVVDLDIAGIDLIATDIARPILEIGGAIIEINENPAFNLQLFPGAGSPRDPGPAIMEMLFPLSQPVRIPVVAVAADAESIMICQHIARLLTTHGESTGLATRHELMIDGVRYPHIDGRNPTGPRTLLNNPDVSVAVVEVDAQSILANGLGFDPCDVVIIGSLSGVKTPFRQPIETVLLRALDPTGLAVLDATNPEIRALASDIEATVVFVHPETPDVSAPNRLETSQIADSPPISSKTMQVIAAVAHGLHLPTPDSLFLHSDHNEHPFANDLTN